VPIFSRVDELTGQVASDPLGPQVALVAGVEAYVVETCRGEVGAEPATGEWVAAVAALELLVGVYRGGQRLGGWCPGTRPPSPGRTRR
jgi:hypothetical protein